MSHDVSDAVSSHVFRRSRAPARCRTCDTYVYLKGRECQKCGLVCHRKCLKALAITCGGRPMPQKVAIFGEDFSAHLCATHCSIPHVVVKCINYIEERGMHIKGIYRVAGAKSKMQSLCRSFENGLNLVDLSEKSPHLVSSVLKLYLRQLPESLLMHANYPDLIEVALQQQDNPEKREEHLSQLREILLRLPKANRYTLRFIIDHLHRVAQNEEQNQMSSLNLGIVFGPTLIRPKHEHSSSSIVHINHHSLITQMMIERPDIFQVAEEETEYGQFCINPKVSSMSDVLPISTRTSIKLLASSDHHYYEQALRRKKSNRRSIKTSSEPNVLEPTCSTRLVAPPFPGAGSLFVTEDESHTRIIRAFSEPSKSLDGSFGSQDFPATRSDVSNISSEMSSTDNLLDSTDETSFFDTDEDETCLQEYVAQQLKGVRARLQVLRKCSLSTSDSDDGAVLNVKYVQSSQSEVSSDPFVPACRARLVNLGINQTMLRPRLSLNSTDAALP